jgi:penicillin-insensitive murein DD-endopeptidase
MKKYKTLRINLKRIIIGVILVGICIFITPQIFHKNKGESESIGNYNGGSMEYGYLLPYSDKNFICYSWLSYYLLGREYINSKVYNTVLASYADLRKSYPDRKFVYMEAAKRKGGKMYPHRTHQNGLSMDFMSPLVKKNGKPKYFKLLGIFRYALNFDKDGKSTLNSDISIDFNLIAEHILILDKNARKQGLKIKKVIFNIDLKDNLYQTDYGKKLKKSGIYLAQNLTPLINKLHDDHYHIDFELIDKKI